MVIIIESLIGILLFTILIVPLTLKNPLISVGDYPTAIREKCIELGLIEKREQRFTRADIIRKGTALVVFVFVFAFILKPQHETSCVWKGLSGKRPYSPKETRYGAFRRWCPAHGSIKTECVSCDGNLA